MYVVIGSMITQVLIALAVSGSLLLGIYRRKVKGVFSRIRSKKDS